MRAIAITHDHQARSKKHQVFALFVFIAMIAMAGSVFAQTRTEKPKPRPVTLKTKDGIKLRAFYFPSDKEKEAIPVLLVHEWQGQASPYRALVLALNKAGCAVLIPDYRGHGGSKDYTDRRGNAKKFNTGQMSKRDIENIIAFDLEKAKGFLKEENNAGNLNLNALVVIGIREGCVMAAKWAQRDWNFPSVGRIKQGQDVKALIFISPEKQVKGIAIDPTLTDLNLLRLPIMIVAGDSSPEASEAERVAKRIESYKKRMGRGEAQGFELALPKTKLSGSALVKEAGSVIPAITSFIETEVVIGEEENPWLMRN